MNNKQQNIIFETMQWMKNVQDLGSFKAVVEGGVCVR